jgi:hypothetical protein
VVSKRDHGASPELVLLIRESDGALTLQVRNWGYAVQLQIGEDVEEYRRQYTVAALDVPRMIDAWWQSSGDQGRSQAPPVEDDELDLSTGRLIIGDLIPGEEGSTIIGRFITWLTAHGIPYRSAEHPSVDDPLARLGATLSRDR